MIHLSSVDSTNDYILREDYPSGTVVWADSQTAGRGRGDHRFASPEGGIYFSCLLKDLSFEEALLLTPKAAVAVCMALEDICGLSPRIKWVNDVLLEGKKVCGILCEHYEDRYVAGIDININGNDLPGDLRGIAAGIGDGLSAEIPKEKIIVRISDILLSPMSADTVREEYGRRLSVAGRYVSFTYDGKEKTGVAAGINENCNLLVDTPEGRIALSSGEITLL